MDYYNKHSKEFIEGTINCDMTLQYNLFLKHLNKSAKTILDLGFGSGRDSLYFSKNYEVYSIDPTKVFCDNAIKLGLKNVECISAEEMTYNELFDGIWACASLLHIKGTNLNDCFKKCSKALKNDGVMYCSFKYGDFEGIRNERFFLDLNEESIKKYLNDTNLYIVEYSITDDVRVDRTDKWLNVIMKKRVESKTVQRTHELMLENKKYDIAIDATVGNGYDTLFLAKYYKKVIGIDIQELAIKRSKQKLQNYQNVELYLDDFNNIDRFKYANLIIFNLGFLPGSNKKIKTQDYTSNEAILKAYNILDGILIIACYIQHEGGYEEYLRLINTLKENNIKYEEESCLDNKEILIIIKKNVE